jgi:hypothetical protein
MTRSFLRLTFTAFFTLALLLLLSVYIVAAQEDTIEEPDNLIVVTSEPFEMTFGSGPFNLFAPAEGLSALSSYRATLIVSFEGTNAGQDEQWSRTYTMLVTQTPPARQLTIENSEDTDAQVYMAEVDNTAYERRDGNACFANAVDVEGAFAEQWEPAGFLDSVIGADEAGTETVNDVEANHYTFDESAQGASGIAESTGELWVAAAGGYLVRYTLTTTSNAAYFGEGIEGTMMLDYELTDVNQRMVIGIPEDCPPPLLDVPVMPDAADVFQGAGSTSYTTPSTVQEVAAFYEEQVAALGGQPANHPVINESSVPFVGSSATALFGFTLGDQSIMLLASSDGSTTNVQLQRMDDPAALSFTAEVPTIVLVPEDTLGDCAAGGTPILPDASEVISSTGVLNYLTSTSVGDAAAYYQEQFTALGAQVAAPTSIEGMTMFDVTQGVQTISVTFMPESANTRVSLTSNTGSPVTPTTNCASLLGLAPGECEADGIPTLPDATNVQSMAALLSYDTNTSIADAVAFYEEHITALGGQVSSTMPATDQMAVLNVTLDNQSLMMMIGSNGRATNVSISSLTGGSVPPPSHCAAAAGQAPTEAPVVTEPENTTGTACTAGTDSFPIPVDAANIQAGGGLLSYTTRMSMADITAFYEEQVAALGGQVSSMSASDMMTSFDVRQGDQSVSVIIISGGGVNNVTFTSTNPMTPLTYCTVAAPAPTAAAATDQETGDCITSAEAIPMLPDAANVLNMGGTITYTTSTSMADAVAFYQEQLSPLGEITSPMPASDAMTMMNVAIGDYSITVSITAFDQQTNSVSVGFIATDAFAGPPDCMASAVPQTGLPSDGSAAACTVSTATNANQRSGPGTNFDLAGTLGAGTNALVDGQATGVDGFVWWRLGDGIWVRSDVVDETGNCEDVPVVQP